MGQAIQIVISALTLLVISLGTFLLFYRFGLNRERYTFLTMDLQASIVKHYENLCLVCITVVLENKGQNRISARRYQDLRDKNSIFLYKDEYDECKHAGTLKIRNIPNDTKEKQFDWDSLKPREFEQINYLFEYQDPVTNFKDVDFWLEPKEIYKQQVMLWLKPNSYSVKALFLGKMLKYGEEEYWSCTKPFNFSEPLSKASY